MKPWAERVKVSPRGLFTRHRGVQSTVKGGTDNH